MHQAVVALSPDDPAEFLTRPHGYCDLGLIDEQLATAGFRDVEFQVQRKDIHASSARDIVMGALAGSPLAAELEERGLTQRARNVVEAALHHAYGTGPIAASMQATIPA